MNVGGIENLLMNLYRVIDREKIQFDFLVHTDKECFFDHEIESLGGIVHRILKMPWQKVGRQINIYRKFFEEHPEYSVVHSHISLSSFGIIYAAAKANRPVRVVHTHSTSGGKVFSTRVKQFSFLFIGRYLTHRFACSEAAARWAFRSQWKKAVILKNGVDTNRFHFCPEIRERTRAELGCGDKFVVGHVGSFSAVKNHTFLLDCFAELKRIRPDAFLILVGDGKLRPEIEAKIARLGLRDFILLTGVEKKPERFLQAMDVFLFPSLFEGFPMSIPEAVAAGLPIVASNTITKEIALSDLVNFVSLSESPKVWAKKVLDIHAQERTKPREEYFEVVKNAGFDIRESAEWLTHFYLSEYEKSKG